MKSILFGLIFGCALSSLQGQDLSLLNLTNQTIRAVLDFYQGLEPGTVLIKGLDIPDRQEITLQSEGPIDRNTVARLIEEKLHQQEGITLLPVNSPKEALSLDLPRLGNLKHALVFHLPMDDKLAPQDTNGVAIWIPRSPLQQVLRLYEEFSGKQVRVKGMGVTLFPMLTCDLRVPFSVQKETALELLEVALSMQVQGKVVERDGNQTIIRLGSDMPQIEPMDYKLLALDPRPPQANALPSSFIEPPYEGDWTNSGLPGFEVKGRLETENPGGALRPGSSNRWSFYAQVTSQHYFTRLIAPNQFITETSSDGQSIYQVKWSTAPRTPPVWATHMKDQSVFTNLASTALVETNLVPYGDAMFGSIWLAYLSRSYLETNQLINPMWMVEDPTLRAKNYQVSFVYLKGEEGLPKEIQFLNDGIYHRVDSQRRLPAPYEAGFTNAFFYWNQYTNVSGMSVPTQFTFVIYRWPFDGKPPIPNTTIRGIVESVQPLRSQGVIVRPKLRGRATITDRRVPQTRPLIATEWEFQKSGDK